MNWELLNAVEFSEAPKTCKGVCLLPIGVMEKHGDHLPLGQDTLYIHKICSLAAEKEPAMVFPFYYFGSIDEARHVPGTIWTRPALALQLLENMCDEIYRNGFDKIIIVNGHGGNLQLIPYFMKNCLGSGKEYLLFSSFGMDAQDQWTAKGMTAKVDGHAGECETSLMLHLAPELVNMDLYGAYGLPLERFKHFHEAGLKSPLDWYSQHPGHYRADDTLPSAEKGGEAVNKHLQHLIKQIRTVKEDTKARALLDEYLARSRKPENHRS